MMVHLQRQKGFSLIEMMVSMVIGLIVALAVTTLAVAILRNNTEVVQSTRVTQDLRISSELIARELKRAGYNQNAVNLVSNQDGYDSGFDQMIWGDAVDSQAGDCEVVAAVGEASSCLLFSYDRLGINDGADDPNGQEWKGFRRVFLEGTERGVLQMFLGSAADEPDCDDGIDAAGWETLTPPGIDVTNFSLANSVSDPIELATIPGASVQVRSVGIQIVARPIGSDRERQICDEVRVRADEVLF